MTAKNPDQSVVDVAALPDQFPTCHHDPRFWEGLGRAVATFGFLEEMLAKAIFALTATRPYEEAQLQAAYEAWLPTLERALTDPLGNLIDTYGKALRDHPGAAADDLEDLLTALRRAAEVRNVLCHGSWRAPNASGASVPFFVNRKKHVFDTSIDLAFLTQVQRHTAELSCAVISSVSRLGWRFPGANGPGRLIWGDPSLGDHASGEVEKNRKVVDWDARRGITNSFGASEGLMVPPWWFIGVSLVASAFYGWKAVAIFGVAKDGKDWSWWVHQVWLNFLGAIAGWAALWASSWALAGSLSKDPFRIDGWLFGTLAVGFIGITGYLPRAMVGVSGAFGRIVDKAFPGKGE